MDVTHLSQGDPSYPSSLSRYLRKDAPSTVATLGNLEVLKDSSLGFFCSVKCPGGVILQTHDLAWQLVRAGVTVIGGFHSPVERECLRILLRGTQPIIICPARGLKKMRIPKEWKKLLEEGRLLFLSPFPDNRHRSDTEMALYRNRFVAALADRILVTYAAPGGKTEQFCREILSWGKPLFTLPDANKNLNDLGAKAITADEVFCLPQSS